MQPKEKGFTLVEVLLAVSIFMILFSAFMGFYIRSLKSHKLSDEQIDANSSLRHLQRIFLKDLQEVGFGELRASIHPLNINNTGTETVLTLQLPNTISHLKNSALLPTRELRVFDAAGLHDNDNAVLISSEDAIRVTIDSIDDDVITLKDDLAVSFDSNSRLITYSIISYRWNKVDKTLTRLVNGNPSYTWQSVDTFEIVFFDPNGDNISNPSTSTRLSHAQSKISIKKDESTRSALVTSYTHLQNAGAL